MKKMQNINVKTKLLPIFFIVLLMFGLFACLSGAALAEEAEPVVYASSGHGKAGETVTLTVSLENNPGLSSYGITLWYDPSKLTYEFAKAGELLPLMFTAVKRGDDKVNFNSVNFLGNFETGSLLFSFTLTIKGDVTDSVLAGDALKFIYDDNRDSFAVLERGTINKPENVLPDITQPVITIDPCDHVYVGEVTKVPTCVEEGVMTYTCSKCGHSYTEVMVKDSSNHVGGTYEKVITEPTFDTEGLMGIYCSGCNALLSTEPILKLDTTITELLQSITRDVLNAKKGFDDLNNVNLVLTGKTLTLVVDGREIVLSTNANNKNQSGQIDLGDGYKLVFDIKGNGSNVKEFSVIKK
ncbi:MAG: cohesin domain-containing protein [Nitrososphaerota archaeon]|jgi:hypothetical protein|nr:cohesin domain-containing protein [Nitrososphaerota archaeon]